MIKKLLTNFFWISLFLFLQGCSLPYLFHLTTGQLRLIEKREPIEKVLQEKRVGPLESKKLELVLAVREFAFNELGLDRNDNYTFFVQLDRPHVAYNIVVCPKDSLEPMTWWFPISGEISYLGFFNRIYAQEEEADYERQGYDTYLRGVSAFSTLGWFSDPVYSSFFRYRDESLVNLIIHELAHSTIYKPGDTSFNEGAATFMGNQGSIRFLKQTRGISDPSTQRALLDQQDDLIFSAFLKKTRDKLEAFYRKPLRFEEKVRGREAVFDDIKNDFRIIKGKLKTTNYDAFENLKLNNAVILAFGQYYESLDLYENLWKQEGGDFKKAIKILKEAQMKPDPQAYLKGLSIESK